MKIRQFKKACTTVLLFLCSQLIFAQIDIFQLMERKDLTIDQVETLSTKYFDEVGKGRGSGYKQFQRWLYEQKFHVDDNGNFLPYDYDWKAYIKAKGPLTPKTMAGPGAWTEMGPWNWTRTSGWNPGVGRITSIAVNPANSNVIYVTSPGGGLWKTTTGGGGTWTPLTDNNSTWMNMYSVAVDPLNPSNVYAGNSGSTVMKSVDAGATWANSGSGLSGTIWKILPHPSIPGIVFVAANGGIYRSTNSGATWTRVHTISKQDIEFKPNNPNIMYATGTGDVQRSTDGGITWTLVEAASGITTTGRTLVSVSPADPERVYLVQASGSSFGRFFRSTDAGLTFTTTIVGSSASCTNFFGYENSGCGTGGQATYDMAMTVNPLNADEVHIAGIICWKSINAGNSFVAETVWSLPNSVGYNHADVHVLEWVGNTIYSGSDGGIYKSTDKGDNWIDLSGGLGIRQFYRIANSKTDAAVFSGGAQDNGSSMHKATGWIDWLGADGMDCLISPLNASLAWGTSQNGGIYRTTNGGSSYSNLSQPGAGQWVTPLAIESNSNVIYGGWNGVYKSIDNGSSWTKISGATITSTLAVLAVAPSNPAYIYASNGSTLYVTTDAGASWNVYTAPTSINAISVSPTDPTKIWMAGNTSGANRAAVSTNAGASFTDISGNLPAVSARSITVDNNTAESVYIGMNLGVYYTDNTQTNTWIDLSDNIPKVAINEVEIQKSSSSLRIGTYGRGVWERTLFNAVAPCIAPSSLVASAISNSSATLGWGNVDGAVSYDVEYKLTSTSTWTIAASTTASTNVPVSGLLASTVYDWRVRSNCNSGSSDYTLSQFTTLANCDEPTGLNSSNITATGATINWLSAVNAASYDVDYKTNASATWLNAATETTELSVALSGLVSSTVYNWRIKSICNSNGSSGYSQSSFTTNSPPICNDGYESNNTSKTGSSINFGNTINAGITTSTDQDWFKLSIGNNALTNVQVKLTDLPADYDLYLYNKSNVLVASSTNSGTTSETVVYNTNVNKTSYTVKVVGKDGAFNTASCYSLLPEVSSSSFTPEAPSQIIAMDEKDIKLYPNPAMSQAMLVFNSVNSGNASIRILAANGTPLQTENVFVSKGINWLPIDLTHIRNGIYLVEVLNGKSKFSKKLMVIK